MMDDTPDRVADYMGRDPQHNDGERWTIEPPKPCPHCGCSGDRTGTLLDGEGGETGNYYCPDCTRTYPAPESIEVVPASRADALAEALMEIADALREHKEGWGWLPDDHPAQHDPSERRLRVAYVAARGLLYELNLSTPEKGKG